LSNLHDSDAGIRIGAADNLRDLLEFHGLDEQGFRKVWESLIKRLEVENDTQAQESILNAVLQAVDSENVSGLDFPWDVMIRKAPELKHMYLAEYVFPILGLVRKKEYSETVRKYLTHPDENVRNAAGLALIEIGE
jgi:HEAT repeat protein